MRLVSLNSRLESNNEERRAYNWMPGEDVFFLYTLLGQAQPSIFVY